MKNLAGVGRVSGVIVVLAALTMAPAGAGMTVGFDTRTLNDVLPALTASEIEVPLSETNTITVSIDRMRITGLQPGAGADGSGRILTSMRVRVPQTKFRQQTREKE